LPTTTRHALRYPASTASPDVPTDMSNAMTDVDNALPYVASSTPGSPVSGLVWYNSTTGEVKIYDGSSFKNVSPPLWTAFTATWTASTTNPTIGNGAIVARYVQLGPKTVNIRIDVTIGSTTNGGSGTYSFALPTQAASDAEQFLGFRVSNGSTNFVGFGYIPLSSTTVRPFAVFSNGSAAAVQLANGLPGLSPGATLSFWGIYETV